MELDEGHGGVLRSGMTNISIMGMVAEKAQQVGFDIKYCVFIP